MWYSVDYMANIVPAPSFVRDVIDIFTQTLARMGRVSVLGFFLAFFAASVIFGLCLKLITASKPGGRG